MEGIRSYFQSLATRVAGTALAHYGESLVRAGWIWLLPPGFELGEEGL